MSGPGGGDRGGVANFAANRSTNVSKLISTQLVAKERFPARKYVIILKYVNHYRGIGLILDQSGNYNIMSPQKYCTHIPRWYKLCYELSRRTGRSHCHYPWSRRPGRRCRMF